MPDRRAAWGLIVLAVVVRAGAVLALQSHHVPRSTYEHGEIAANLLAGRGYSVRFLGADGPTSQQAPVYPFLVAAAYAAGGVETPRALLILELAQAVLGGALVAAVMMLAREAAPGRVWVARASGFAAAVHPTLVYAATHVQVALPAATLLALTLAWAYRAGRTGRAGDAAAAGLWLALLGLTDPILLLASAGVGLAIVLGQPPKPAARLVATAGLAALLGLAPWTARNYRVHGEFVAVKSTFGYAFWQGNCAASMGTDKVVRASVERALARGRSWLDPKGMNAALWEARHEAGYLDDVVLSADDVRELGRLSEPERSRNLFRRALADLRDDPGRYPRLCLRRLRYFVAFDETNPKARNPVYRAGHLGLTGVAVAGLVLAPWSLRKRLGPTLVTAALVAAFHSLTIVSARFHVPVEPLMGLWAATGLAGLRVPVPAAGPWFALAAQPRRPTTSKASSSTPGLA